MTKCVVRAGLSDETSPSYVSLDGFEPSTLQASLLFAVDPSLSFESADELDKRSIDAKLKLEGWC